MSVVTSNAGPPGAAQRPGIGAIARRIVARPEFGPFVLLMVELIVFTSLRPAFLGLDNIGNILAFTVELGLIALAMTLLMTAGEFDLSVGSVFGFSAVVMWTLFNEFDVALEIAFVLAIAVALVHRPGQRLLRDPPEDPLVPRDAGHAARRPWLRPLHHRWLPAAHLGTARAAARGASRGRLLDRRAGTACASTCRSSGSSSPRSSSRYVLTLTKTGNWIQASGGNASSARARGVRVSWVKTGLFMLTAAMAAFAGIISSIRTSSANPNSGTGYELEVIAMVVIGGTALTGGRGTILGTILGVFILRVMRNGIVMVGVPGLAYNIFIGAIILGMMALHSWLERRHHAGT